MATIPDAAQGPAPFPDFLLRLDRSLRQLEDTGEILSVSARLLGQQLQAQQVACFDIGQQLRYATLQHAWSDGLAPGAAGEYFLGEDAAGLAAGDGGAGHAGLSCRPAAG